MKNIQTIYVMVIFNAFFAKAPITVTGKINKIHIGLSACMSRKLYATIGVEIPIYDNCYLFGFLAAQNTKNFELKGQLLVPIKETQWRVGFFVTINHKKKVSIGATIAYQIESMYLDINLSSNDLKSNNMKYCCETPNQY